MLTDTTGTSFEDPKNYNQVNPLESIRTGAVKQTFSLRGSQGDMSSLFTPFSFLSQGAAYLNKHTGLHVARLVGLET